MTAVLSISGIFLLAWSLRALIKRHSSLTGSVIVLIISIVYVMLSSAYLEIRSINNVISSIGSPFTQEKGQFRSRVDMVVERASFKFDSADEEIPKNTQPDTLSEIASKPTTNNNIKYVKINGAILVGADGHRITLKENPIASNPTWIELKEFLEEDKTDEMTYNYTSFVCADFAEMLHNNAEVSGIKSAYVTIELGPSAGYSISGGHALNAFQTTDRGLIYIDCTAPIGEKEGNADKVVKVEVGQPYIPESVFPTGNWYWVSMGVVEIIELVQW